MRSQHRRRLRLMELKWLRLRGLNRLLALLHSSDELLLELPEIGDGAGAWRSEIE